MRGYDMTAIFAFSFAALLLRRSAGHAEFIMKI